LTGLARGCDLAHTAKDLKGQDPVMITLLQHTSASEAMSTASQEGESMNVKGCECHRAEAEIGSQMGEEAGLSR